MPPESDDWGGPILENDGRKHPFYICHLCTEYLDLVWGDGGETDHWVELFSL